MTKESDELCCWTLSEKGSDQSMLGEALNWEDSSEERMHKGIVEMVTLHHCGWRLDHVWVKTQ
jgi:hypothetical protein